jgi:hypothetical protein
MLSNSIEFAPGFGFHHFQDDYDMKFSLMICFAFDAWNILECRAFQRVNLVGMIDHG